MDTLRWERTKESLAKIFGSRKTAKIMASCCLSNNIKTSGHEDHGEDFITEPFIIKQIPCLDEALQYITDTAYGCRREA
jgi:hypothetical protein